MQDTEFITRQLDNQIKESAEEIIECQKQLVKLQEIYYKLVARKEYVELNAEIIAKSKKTLFSRVELKKKFGFGDATFYEIKKFAQIEPVDKRGKEVFYDLSTFEQARKDYYLWKKHAE